ncbi:MAG TPA: biotin carboxylase N-terminal domain-containing protein [Steroidobacteraceae bacterium]|nr:biotin carboxylase N-terminal domain-containing protein [Steroidobacteraceae bacterium]
MIRKLLIANRGEIACRILRTARRLGIAASVVYSEADERARHVRLADEAWPIGPAPAKESYLNVSAILAAAKRSGAEAIHPGYGFLSESEEFAAACAAAGLLFIGPPPAAIAAMGEKSAAKERMKRAGVPVLEGYAGEDQSLETLERCGLELGFPLIIKPSAGGGGKGMQIVRKPAELRDALETARRIASSAFGDGRILLERYLAAARHVEVQVLADSHGRVLHLLDRDCSVQRRHQKLIEEAPAPGLEAALRAAIADAACTVAREVGYVGAGTVEMLLDGGAFYFMEMNTRLQVEHPVTEAITGLDLVEWQLRIAAGEPLPFAQSDIAARGHAIEARVCAEDPARNFLPCAGTLRLVGWPVRTGIRVDQGFETGDVVPPHYDSLLGKVVAHAATRSEAIERLHAALSRTLIAGVPSNLEWLADALGSAAFERGVVDTSFIAQHGAALGVPADPRALAPFAAAACVFALRHRTRQTTPWAQADGFRLGGSVPIEVTLGHADRLIAARVRVLNGSTFRVALSGAGEPAGHELEVELGTGLAAEIGHRESPLIELRSREGGTRARALSCDRTVDVWADGHHAEFEIHGRAGSRGALRHAAGSLTTVLPGVVVSVQATAGQRVAAGDPLVVIEAMKMEHSIRAPQDGLVEAVHVRPGDRVSEGATLVTLAAHEGNR